MFDVPDHPIVANMMRTGYPDGQEPQELKCPICGADAENFYTTAKTRTIVGCERCLITRNYYEFEAEELG